MKVSRSTYALVAAAGLFGGSLVAGSGYGLRQAIASPASFLPPQDAPVGSILAFAGVFNESPTGNWRLCRGQSVRRSDFPTLFTVIGTAWGEGDNPGTTFSLPDLRGVFLRGVAQGTPVDPDRDLRTARNGGNAGDKVGSFQDFATALPRTPFVTGNESNTHTHNATTNARTEGGPNTFDAGDERGVTPTASIAIGPNNQGHTHRIEGGGDHETRPVNVYVNYVCRVR